MNKNIVISVIVVVILIAGGIYWFVQGQNGTTYTAPTNSSTETSSTNNSSTTTTTTQHTTRAVIIQNFAFSPTSLTIKAGDTVVWTNKDSATHTVVGDNGGPSSPNISTSGTYSYTFNNTGTFNYHCSIHPSMLGTVIVTQ